MDENRNDITDDLITRCLTGEASSEEQKQLASWIARNKVNERHYLNLSKAFELGTGHYKTAAGEANINIDQEWNHFVEQVKNLKGKTVVMPPRPAQMWMRIAAALLLLVVSGVVINYFVSKNNVTVYSTAGSSLSIQLEDGTRVDLNRHSQLSVLPAFGKEKREVILKGEAFFDVAHDPQKPFSIQVNETHVQVVGTSFNVRGYEAEDVEVTVETGVVRFSASEEKESISLRAGEKGVYSQTSGQLAQKQNDDNNYLSWKTGRIDFRNANLATVVAALSRTYGKTIVINTMVPASCSVTATFEHQSLEAVLHVLKDTLNLTYRVEGDKIEITQVGC